MLQWIPIPFRENSNITAILVLHPAVTIAKKSTIKFTLYGEKVEWDTAKSRCEDVGQRLAVLDTEEKLTALKEQVWVKI